LNDARRTAVALILLAVAAAFANAVPAGFQFDDFNVIVDNPSVHSAGAWVDSMPGIRGLLKLSYTLNWVSGLGAPGFHAVNVLLHALNAILVFALIRSWKSASGPGADSDVQVAAAVGLLFALHPAQTEAVTYVSGRSVSMMTAFYLGSALLWLRPPDRRRAQFASAALFAAALATRETAWTLPIALLLLARAGGRGWMEAARALRAHWWVLALFAAAVLSIPGYRRLLIESISVRTLGENLLTQIDGVWYLLTRPLLLLRLNIDPDLPVRFEMTATLAAKGLLLVGLASGGFLLLKRRPAIGCALLWTLLHLLPTNSVLPRLDVANDRHLYLAMMGPAWIAAELAWGMFSARAAMTVSLLLAASLGVHTALRNRDYRDEVSLWPATAGVSPAKPRVWNNLGFAYRMRGDTAGARAAFERALALDPSFDKARHNLDALGP
jgi:tetratricopeptide (TPR) repeat protein